MRSRKRAFDLLSIIILLMTSSLTTATAADASTKSSSADGIIIATASTSSSSVREQQLQQLDAKTIDAYERLDKWKRCNVDDIPGSTTEVPSRLVYQHNRKRAAGTGFPTRLTTGNNLGLTDHETAAIFGWTTGDYRLLNPIARGLPMVEFDEYPFLPNKTTKVKCQLTREEVMPYILVLSSALSKLPVLSSQQRLWRGHKRATHPSAKIGSIIEMRGFTSVTRDREIALEFAIKSNEGRSNKRTLICILEHSTARAISKLSARPNETEVLFPPGRIFEIVDPPDDTRGDDLAAVRRAMELMRKEILNAEIELVYVREVKSEERTPIMHERCEDGEIPPHAGEWE